MYYNTSAKTALDWIQAKKAMYVPIAINLVLAAFLSFYLPLRSDEGYTLATISQGFTTAVHRAIEFENYPPFYFGALSLWNFGSENFFWGRMFSVFSIVGAALLLPALGKRYLPNVAPFWLVATFLFNPVVMIQEVDMRCYAFLILLSALLLIYFFDGYLQEKNDRKARWLYVVLAVIGLYTHYFAGFLLAANGVVLVLSRKWGSVGRYLLDMIIPALALAAIIPFIPGQFENQHQAHELSSPLSSIVFMFGVIENFILGMDNIYNLPEVLKLVFLMVVALVWLIAIAVNFQPLRYFFKTKESKMLIIFSSLLIFVTAIHFLLGKSIAQTKYMNSLTIPTLFVFFTAFTLTPSKTWLIHAGAGVLLILYLIVTPLIFVPTIKTEDYKGIATYLEEHEENEEPVIIFENIHELVLKHHYHGDNFLYQFPVDIDFTKAWNHKNWVIQNDEQVEQYFSQKINYPETFWMVTHEKKTNQNIDLGHHHLESFLEQNYETVSTQNFQYMMRVRYMRRKY